MRFLLILLSLWSPTPALPPRPSSPVAPDTDRGAAAVLGGQSGACGAMAVSACCDDERGMLHGQGSVSC